VGLGAADRKLRSSQRAARQIQALGRASPTAGSVRQYDTSRRPSYTLGAVRSGAFVKARDADSGAGFASTGADAKPCSVFDSSHLPAALGFFKLFARPCRPELGKGGYQYDLRSTLAKASS
jgi:hypothetical protein